MAKEFYVDCLLQWTRFIIIISLRDEQPVNRKQP